jgi:hypothetical protein
VLPLLLVFAQFGWWLLFLQDTLMLPAACAADHVGVNLHKCRTTQSGGSPILSDGILDLLCRKLVADDLQRLQHVVITWGLEHSSALLPADVRSWGCLNFVHIDQ